jgi:hypothetical protein
MRYLIICYVLCILCTACGEQQKPSPISASTAATRYHLDTTCSDTAFIHKEQISALQLELGGDGNYRFEPKQNSLYPYEGKWETVKEDNKEYYRFTLNNGEVQKNDGLFILLPSVSNESKICFKK